MADAAPVSAAANAMDSVFNMTVFLFGLNLGEEGNSKWPARLTRRNNDPGGRRKQIRLQYAGIGGSYGCASEATLAQQLMTSASNLTRYRAPRTPERRKPVLCRLADLSARAMAAYAIHICVWRSFRRVVRRAASASTASARAGCDLAVV
jgi:hypothetical protein